MVSLARYGLGFGGARWAQVAIWGYSQLRRLASVIFTVAISALMRILMEMDGVEVPRGVAVVVTVTSHSSCIRQGAGECRDPGPMEKTMSRGCKGR